MALFAEVSFVLILEKIDVMLCPIAESTKRAAAPMRTKSNEYSTHFVTRSNERDCSFPAISYGSLPVSSDYRIILVGCPLA